MTALRVELSHSVGDVATGGTRRECQTLAWPRLSGAERLEFASATPRVAMACDQVEAVVQSSSESARLLARQLAPGAVLQWDAEKGDPLHLLGRYAAVRLDYASGKASLHGSAETDTSGWFRGRDFSAQFAVPAGGGNIVLASNAPCDCTAPVTSRRGFPPIDIDFPSRSSRDRQLQRALRSVYGKPTRCSRQGADQRQSHRHAGRSEHHRATRCLEFRQSFDRSV